MLHTCPQQYWLVVFLMQARLKLSSRASLPLFADMAAPAVDIQKVFHKAHEIVEKDFDVHAAFGKSAGDVVQLFAIRGSHHALPWGMQLMVCVFGLTNGAVLSFFPGGDSPLTMVVLNINDAQTRKCNIFVQLHDLALAGNEHSAKLHDRAKEAHRAQSDLIVGHSLDEASVVAHGAGRARGRAKVAVPGLKSIMMAEFTPEAFFERCSVDWVQVSDYAEIGCDPRLWYSTLVNIDKACYLLKCWA